LGDVVFDEHDESIIPYLQDPVKHLHTRLTIVRWLTDDAVLTSLHRFSARLWYRLTTVSAMRCALTSGKHCSSRRDPVLLQDQGVLGFCVWIAAVPAH
jgi:hypothetical protein